MKHSAKRLRDTPSKRFIPLPNPTAIQEAKAILAAIIARDGPDLLPLFLRLEAEEQTAGANAAGLNRALALAEQRRAA